MTSKNFNPDSPEAANFLARQNPAEKFKALSGDIERAFEKPDGQPKHAGPQLVQAASAPMPIVSQPPVRYAEPQQTRDDEQAMSMAVPERNPGGRPRHGTMPKVEKSFTIPPETFKRIVSISNHEGIRHDKKFSVSYIMAHLLDYALSHVEGTKVIPDENGDGLVIAKREAIQ